MGMRRFFAVCSTVVAAAGLGVAGAAPAGAAGSTRVVEGEMHIGRFDAAVAEAHGYEIRTRSDGTQYSVRKGAPADALPMNVVEGNCGRSWVWEDGIGNASVRLNTGFHVRNAVAARSWRVQLDDNGGTSTQPFSGGASGAYWDETRIVPGLTRGPGYAVVRSDGSNFAILTDGAVCFSGGPSASTIIY
ncbi:hypothetical protein SAMN04489729_1562 [Amycolatopsis lurida]|nr:hypothetical protein SAMN04489729_1562 [Amycolatopsis lurida]